MVLRKSKEEQTCTSCRRRIEVGELHRGPSYMALELGEVRCFECATKADNPAPSRSTGDRPKGTGRLFT